LSTASLQADMTEKIENILAVLSRARVSFGYGSSRLQAHPLKGQVKGFWSVTVRAN
jgi:mRNA-degrading endonuclease YafQ of YafQ-DinJ toxin-antitoxin module